MVHKKKQKLFISLIDIQRMSSRQSIFICVVYNTVSIHRTPKYHVGCKIKGAVPKF